MFIILFCMVMFASNVNGKPLMESDTLFYSYSKDSVLSFIQTHSSYLDSNVVLINITQSADRNPYRAADLTINVREQEKVTVILLDTAKQFLNISFTKLLQPGTYDIFHNNLIKFCKHKGVNYFIALVIKNNSSKYYWLRWFRMK